MGNYTIGPKANRRCRQYVVLHKYGPTLVRVAAWAVVLFGVWLVIKGSVLDG